MNKNLLSILALCSVMATPAAAEFTTSGTGTAYTFAQLAQEPTSGVRAENGAYVLDSSFTVAATDTLRLASGDTLKLATGVTIDVEGFADFAPADTAYITRLDDGGYARFLLTGDGIDLKNVTTDYVGYNFSSENGKLTAENCSFRYFFYKSTSTTASAAINLAYSGQDNVIKNCYFIESSMAALGSPTNGPAKVEVRDCYFYHNCTNNRNYPQINLSNGSGMDVVIAGNELIGGQFTRSGGIAVGNMLGLTPYSQAVIENNLVTENRYGITINGPMTASIVDNQIISNKYETNANNGGSGISIYSNAIATYIEGNLIQDNLWGMTVIGTSNNVNMGKVDDPQAEDYNPGHNTFIDNGNNDVLYDLYNNTANTIWAQGNKWNVEVQDTESIETVIYHQADDENLGQVIFTPAWADDPTSVDTIDASAQVAGIERYDLTGRRVDDSHKGVSVVVTRYTNGTVSTAKQVR